MTNQHSTLSPLRTAPASHHGVVRRRHRLTTAIGILLWLLALCPAPTLHAAPQSPPQPHHERPTVAVVLAGGGAKGMAHIGALRVIEEAGIPIDMVVGNSMGAVVGGLYSIGYTPDALDSLVRAQDWMQLLLDNPNYGRDEDLRTKRDNENYILQMPLERRSADSWNGTGVIRGRNITTMLRQLTRRLPDSISFDSLPIRFCCVATDVIAGRLHEFHDGNMAEAMRSSIAIPGVFTPVKKDSMLLVDGCILNNFPVDVARRMGADIVIGVDLENDASKPEKMTNMVDMLTHIMDVTCNKDYASHVRSCDVFIDMDVNDYTAASFSNRAIDSLIYRGELSTRRKQAELTALKQRIGLPADYRPDPVPHPAFAGRPDDTRPGDAADPNLKQPHRKGSLGLAARFDNDEYASVMLGVTLPLSAKRNNTASLDIRLGERIKIDAQLNCALFGMQHVTLGYLFEHNKSDYYNHGNRVAQITIDRNQLRLQSWRSWRKAMLLVGAKFDNQHFVDVLIDRTLAGSVPAVDDEHYFSYFARAEFNSLDHSYFPRRGSMLMGQVEVITDNLYSFKDDNPFPIFSGHWQTAASLNTRFTLLPSVSARVLLCDGDIPYTLRNVVGGLTYGMKYDQQIPMAGMSYIETVSNALVVAGLKVQQRIGSDNFVFASFNGLSSSAHWETAFEKDTYSWGVAAGYAYRSLIGPMSATLHYSSRTKEVRGFINLGYYF